MIKCDAIGNYIHPSMLRLGMNKCLASKKSMWVFYNMYHKDIFMTSNHEG